jgi:hypothetical protein
MNKEVVAIDKNRANEVMEEIAGMMQTAETFANKSVARLSKLLVEAKQGAYWAEKGFANEDAYIKTLPYSRAQYFNLIGIGLHLGFLPEETIAELGIKKSEALVRISKHSPALTDEWIEKAKSSSHQEFLHDVRDFFKGKDEADVEELEWIRVKASKGQANIIREAMAMAEKMLGSEKSAAHQLETICAEFLSGKLENGDDRLENRNGFIIGIIKNLAMQLDADAISALVGALASIVEGSNE